MTMCAIKVFKKSEVREVGTWRAMPYDASITVDGLPWWRAQGGFGEGREDWVCALPEVGISVRRYNGGEWDEDAFRQGGGTKNMVEAMRAAVRDGLAYVVHRESVTTAELEALRQSKARLERAIEASP